MSDSVYFQRDRDGRLRMAKASLDSSRRTRETCTLDELLEHLDDLAQLAASENFLAFSLKIDGVRNTIALERADYERGNARLLAVRRDEIL